MYGIPNTFVFFDFVHQRVVFIVRPICCLFPWSSFRLFINFRRFTHFSFVSTKLRRNKQIICTKKHVSYLSKFDFNIEKWSHSIIQTCHLQANKEMAFHTEGIKYGRKDGIMQLKSAVWMRLKSFGCDSVNGFVNFWMQLCFSLLVDYAFWRLLTIRDTILS